MFANREHRALKRLDLITSLKFVMLERKMIKKFQLLISLKTYAENSSHNPSLFPFGFI